MHKLAKRLMWLDMPCDAVLTTPLLRPRQTAEIVVNTLGIEPPLEEISGLAPDSTVEKLMVGLTSYQDRQRVLLVGHQPLLSKGAAYLLSGKRPGRLTLDLKKGSLCHIEMEPLASEALGKLPCLLTPKQLRSLA